jgi:ABC-type multidrug transport system permease subunit
MEVIRKDLKSTFDDRMTQFNSKSESLSMKDVMTLANEEAVELSKSLDDIVAKDLQASLKSWMNAHSSKLKHESIFSTPSSLYHAKRDDALALSAPNAVKKKGWFVRNQKNEFWFNVISSIIMAPLFFASGINSFLMFFVLMFFCNEFLTRVMRRIVFGEWN